MDVIDHYLPLAWSMLDSPPSPEALTFIKQLVHHSQLLLVNLVISLYYLYKLQQTSVSHDPLTHVYLVVVLLILSNKVYDDQCYTLKTWQNIIQNLYNHTQVKLELDLGLLNSLEQHFLCALNFLLSFHKMHCDYGFWQQCFDVTPSAGVTKLRLLVLLESLHLVVYAPLPMTPPILLPVAPPLGYASVPGYHTPMYVTLAGVAAQGPQLMALPLTPPAGAIAKPQWYCPPVALVAPHLHHGY